MTTATIDTSILDTLEFDDENFLLNANDWTEEAGTAIAYELGIELTERHWDAIRFARTFHAENNEAPTLRQTTKRGGFNTKEMYQLFEGGPAKLLAQVSGLRKPTGCV